MNWVLYLIRFVLTVSMMTVFTFGVALFIAFSYINMRLEEWKDDNDNHPTQ